MPVLVFDEFIPSKQSAAGKMMPPKAKAGGTTFALNKSVVDLIENSIGTPLDCETKTEQNGKYTNHFVLSARHLASASATPPRAVGSTDTRPTAPPTTSLPSPTEAVVTPTASPRTADIKAAYPALHLGQSSDEARQRLIVRQSALKAALEYHFNVRGSVEQDLGDITATADYFTAWVFKETSPEKSAPRTIAQQHLETVREKVADIRAGYSDEDAVCPACGRKEFLKQWTGGWFCARSKEAGVPGGCGYPEKGARLDSPLTFGEWKAAQASKPSVPWQ